MVSRTTKQRECPAAERVGSCRVRVVRPTQCIVSIYNSDSDFVASPDHAVAVVRIRQLFLSSIFAWEVLEKV